MKINRRGFFSFSAVAALLATGYGPTSIRAQVPTEAGTAPQTAKRTVRLFLIGNSFSQNATRYLPQMAKEGGHELILGRAEIGGAPMQRHWDAVAAHEANPEDPKGKPYGGKSLRMLLTAGTWDVVTIQQASIVSGSISNYQPYAKQLHDFIKSVQPNAEVVLHQTWAYRSDAKTFTRVRPDYSAQNQQEMWEESRKAYHQTAKELGLRIIPTGDAFWKVSSDPQWGYKKDAAYDFTKPVFPNIPNQTNSLHTGYSWRKDKDGVDSLAFDPNHANEAGCYLGGLVWYGFLFNESPEKLTFAPPSVPAPFAAHLRKVAWQTVQESQQAKVANQK